MNGDQDMPKTGDVIVNAAGGLHRIFTYPLVGRLDSVHLFLILGVIMISSVIWTRVLAHIKG